MPTTGSSTRPPPTSCAPCSRRGRTWRQVLAWVAEHHGVDAVADVALILGGDLGELITLRARDEVTAPLEVWDRWSHDEPMPGG